MKWPCCACCGTDRGARCNFPRRSVALGHHERCDDHQADLRNEPALQVSWGSRPAVATLRPWWMP